jgi:hypothetical protein
VMSGAAAGLKFGPTAQPELAIDSMAKPTALAAMRILGARKG